MLSCEKELWKSTKLEKKGKMTVRGKIVEAGIVGISMIPGEKHWHEKVQRWHTSSTEDWQKRLTVSHLPSTCLASTDLLHVLLGAVSILILILPVCPDSLLCVTSKNNRFILFRCSHPSCSVFIRVKSCPNSVTDKSCYRHQLSKGISPVKAKCQVVINQGNLHNSFGVGSLSLEINNTEKNLGHVNS